MKSERGTMSWASAGNRAQASRRKELHRDFERALVEAKLPERPEYEEANRFSSRRGGELQACSL